MSYSKKKMARALYECEEGKEKTNWNVRSGMEDDGEESPQFETY